MAGRVAFFILLQAVLTASVTFAQSLPKIDVKIERIDTGRYPDIDVYFRVIDTNAATEIHPLVNGDVRLFEGPLGGTQAPATIASHNFENPELRPLASAVAIDKSGSVDDVIGFILAAVKDFASLMKQAAANTYRPTDPNRGLDDVTYAIAFAGEAVLELARQLAYTAVPSQIQAWADANISSGGWSPCWAGLDLAVTATLSQYFDQPDAARVVFLISDGQNNRGYPEAPTDLAPDRAIRNAQAGRIRAYALGMSFVDDRGVVTGDVDRTAMQRVANETGGSYFEPHSPYPVVPGAPLPRDGNFDGKVGADLARTYLTLGMGTTANFARGQVKRGGLPAYLQDVASKVLQPPPTTFEEYTERFKENQTPPTFSNLDQVTYRDLNAIQSAMVELARNEVTITDLQRKDYYRDQVRNILAKIQSAEKTVYRVTHRVADEKYDGSVRQIAVQVQYNSTVNKVVTMLQPGTAFAYYKVPSFLPEDREAAFAFPINMSYPAAQVVFDEDRNPRGGPWSGGLELRMTTKLVSEIQVSPEAPVQQVVVARRDPLGNYFEVPLPPNLPNLDQIARHIEAEKADYPALLGSMRAEGDYDSAAKVFNLRLRPLTPTAVRNPDDPAARPLANLSETDFPRKLHYEVEFEISRPYSYKINVPPSSELRQVDTLARLALPGMVFYIQDRTPPTIGVFLTPSVRSTALIAVRQQLDFVDKDPMQMFKVALLGDPLGIPAPTPKTLVNGFDAAPYQLDGGGATPGFVIEEHQEMRVQVVARDNFDRNLNHRYVLETTLPETDDYSLSTRELPAVSSGTRPFLGRIPFGDIGRRRQGEGNAFSGVAYRFQEAGETDDNQGDRKVFRSSNVEPTGSDSFRVIAGREIFLTVKASDASGNQSEIKIPILVKPVGLNISMLNSEHNRR
jgi:hypothetical protein